MSRQQSAGPLLEASDWSQGQGPEFSGAASSSAATGDNLPSRLIGWLFLLCALVLIAFGVLLLSAFIVHKTYVGEETGRENRLEMVWAWLLAGSLGWGLVNLFWALQSRRRQSATGFNHHFALTIGCGLAAIGIQAVMFARSLTMLPVVLDYSAIDERPASAVTAPAASASASGDPEEGRKVFSTTCITCHGAAGQGLPNLAPSLVGSSFIGSADDTAIAKVVRLGRMVGDPNNKSGKMMPPKGGNPFLTEVQIAHLVAFVRSIQSGTASASAAGGPSAPAGTQLAKWVVPDGAPPPAGVNDEAVDNEGRDGAARGELFAQRRQSLMRNLTLGLTGAHGLFLLVLVMLSSALLLSKLIAGGEIPEGAQNLLTGGWIAAAVAWAPVFVLCFWWS